MTTAAIAIDGVMRKLVTSAPIPEGMRLYHSLARTGAVVLLADEEHKDDRLETWLEMEGCVNHSFVRYVAPELSGRVDQMNRLRMHGHGVDLVVEPDPAIAAQLVAAGFNVCLFTHASYAHPSWRPDTDTGIQPWSDLSEQIATQARLRARDTRLKRDDD